MERDIAYAVLGVAIVAICCSVWGMVCNNRTLRQRRAVIRQVFRQNDWPAFEVAFDTVTYNRHMFALMLLRNPYALYPASIRALMEGSPP